MRVTSCILSLALHLLVLFLGLYLPKLGGTHIHLDRPVYQVELVRMPQAKPVAKVEPPAPPEATKAKPKLVRPARQETPGPKPVKLASRNEAPKARPKPSTPQAAPKKRPQPRPATASQPSRQEPKRPKAAAPSSPQQVLAQALGEVEQEVDQSQARTEDLLEQEIATLRQQLADQGQAGRRQEGRAGMIYGRLVEQIVRSHWRYPAIDPSAGLRAEVELTIEQDGTIADVSLIQGSGRQDFDASVLRAVEETGRLQEPPGGITTIRITFNLNEEGA